MRKRSIESKVGVGVVAVAVFLNMAAGKVFAFESKVSFLPQKM